MNAPTYIVVSGTGTEIGKTVVTAALAALARAEGLRVGIAKPIQTGLEPTDEGDCQFAGRLAGVDATFEHRRLFEALAPETAVRRAGSEQSTTEELAGAVRGWVAEQEAAGAPFDVVLVEGAGGLLARLGTDVTIIDIARELDAPIVLVTQADLGTLSTTELTTKYLHSSGIECAGMVIGSWPEDPDLPQRCNLEDLPRLTGTPLVGKVPTGVGALTPEEFARCAPGWFEAGVIADIRG